MTYKLTASLTKKILATYREQLNIRNTATTLGLALSIVDQVVVEHWGEKRVRFAPGSECAKLLAAKCNRSTDDQALKEHVATLNRLPPDELCRQHLKERFEERHGSYWLDGRHCPDINVRMRAVNRARLADGLEQLPVPEWRV